METHIEHSKSTSFGFAISKPLLYSGQLLLFWEVDSIIVSYALSVNLIILFLFHTLLAAIDSKQQCHTDLSLLALHVALFLLHVAEILRFVQW